MRSTLLALILLSVGVFVGMLLGSGSPVETANADTAVEEFQPRFQISAWGAPLGGQFDRGCYIVDTVTGELWHASKNLPPQKISDRLLKRLQGPKPQAPETHVPKR